MKRRELLQLSFYNLKFFKDLRKSVNRSYAMTPTPPSPRDAARGDTPQFSEQDVYDDEVARMNHMCELATRTGAAVDTGPLEPPALNPDGSEVDPSSGGPVRNQWVTLEDTGQHVWIGDDGKVQPSGPGDSGREGGGKSSPAAGDPMAGHPLAGKSADEARDDLRKLTVLGSGKMTADPWKLSDRKVTTADAKAVTASVSSALEAAKKANSFDRPNFDKVYDAVAKNHPGLSRQDFNAVLVKGAADKKWRLDPFTLALRDLKNPHAALPLDGETKYYLDSR